MKTQLEAKIETLANTNASTAAITDKRLERLEEPFTTSFLTIQERFDVFEETLKAIARSPIFASQFVNNPYLQEKTQAPTPP